LEDREDTVVVEGVEVSDGGGEGVIEVHHADVARPDFGGEVQAHSTTH